MNNYQAIERLSNIFTLLYTDGEDASIARLSETLEIPIEVIRQDMNTILRNDIFRTHFDEEYYDEEDCPDIDDNTEFSLQRGEFFFSQDTAPIYVTNRETDLLTKYYPELMGSDKHIANYRIKESPTQAHYKLDALCEQIQDAIDLGHYLKFNYKGNKSTELRTYELAPRLIYHNINNGRIYMITTTQERFSSWRLDAMSSVVTLYDRKDNSAMPPELLKRFDYLWGLSNENIDEPVHVKVRIDAFSRNILEKIRNDISRRKYAKLYQEGDYWYYEDDIIGFSAFRSWIYQFGYSVVVMEPESLAREVYESAAARVEKYKDTTQQVAN